MAKPKYTARDDHFVESDYEKGITGRSSTSEATSSITLIR